MNNIVLKYGLRFVLLLLFQVLVLKQIPFGPIGSIWADPFVYPLFIMLLPVKTAKELLLILAFGFGLLVDAFYDSWGVHASALVFMAFLRPALLRRLEPQGGYTLNYGLTIRRYNLIWFAGYAAWMLAFFLLFYNSMLVFTPVYTVEILLRTFLSFVTSFLFVLIFMLIFNPLD